MSLYLLIHTPLIYLEDRELCNFPNNWYQSFGYRESTPKLKCFLSDGPHLTREFPKRKALSTLIEKSEKTMEDARLGSIQMIGALQVMLEAVGQFGLLCYLFILLS